MKNSGTEDPGMNPCSYAHLIFDKGVKKIQQRKDSLFNNFFLGKLDLCMQKTEIRSMSFTYQLKVD
jgi:hypothetical protein